MLIKNDRQILLLKFCTSLTEATVIRFLVLILREEKERRGKFQDIIIPDPQT
jgi:hypothetical protein